jgi:hypothetical protein
MTMSLWRAALLVVIMLLTSWLSVRAVSGMLVVLLLCVMIGWRRRRAR